MSEFDEIGVCIIRQPFAAAEMALVAAAVDGMLTEHPGSRAFILPAALSEAFTAIASDVAREHVRLVRILAFDKVPARNWGVPWHQDRTIAVRARAEVPGFGPWSVKAGTPHVQPPLALMERMIVLRYHIDDCGPENGPLKIISGSHKLGRVRASEAASLAASKSVVTCCAGAGDILAMKALMIHASAPADAPSHRRILHMDFSGGKLPAPLEWAIYG